MHCFICNGQPRIFLALVLNQVLCLGTCSKSAVRLLVKMFVGCDVIAGYVKTFLPSLKTIAARCVWATRLE